jgi:2-keto-3-deoxy-L-rhamnonate aldolase RhmA
MNRSNPLRKGLAKNRKLFGCWLQLPSPPIAEMMALVGYDLLVIDMEHGPVALSEAADMMRGIARTDPEPWFASPPMIQFSLSVS